MAFESTLKYNFTPKELVDKKAKERKINLLLLIQHFLKSEGYVESYYQLLNEAKLPKDYEICDNMELNNILQDYETFYYIRFQKYPKISKKVPVTNDGCEKKNISKATIRKQPTLKEREKNKKESSDVSLTGMAVLPLSPECCETFHHDDRPDDKLFKPLGCFEGYSDEWKTLADIIAREIVEKNLNVKWDDVIGLDEAKAVMKEAIVYPMKYPQLYKGKITPWKGLLMYGPSGTGKTLLAKAVASECKTTFFNISASSIVSKWRGDSEKLVRVMFDLARLQAPSTIFVDELDAIASQRDSTHEHEASRRLKSELLVQLDGLCESNVNVFFLTTSNLPWDLDVAILRRLEKKILIGLPELDARQKLIQMYLPAVVMTDPLLTVNIDYKLFAQECHGYSGSDIKLLCKEVTMGSLRQIFSDLESNKRAIGNNMSRPKLKPISDEDFSCALKKIKATTATSIERYLKWTLEFGSI